MASNALKKQGEQAATPSHTCMRERKSPCPTLPPPPCSPARLLTLCQLGWARCPVVWSNTDLDVSVMVLVGVVYVYNQLTIFFRKLNFYFVLEYS